MAPAAAGPDAGAPGGDWAPIERVVGWRFARPALLREALTHRSVANGTPGPDPRRGGARKGGQRDGRRGGQAAPRGTGSNERLEFIGDRVLGLLMAEWLIERFPVEQEGQLGPRLAQLVSRPVLARIAVELGFRDALAVAPHEARAGIRDAANVLADTVEAVLGALFLDGGLEPARGFVRRAWGDAVEAQALPPKDPKTALQEWLLGRGMALPSYRVEAAAGPSHAPAFTVRVEAAGQSAVGTAGAKRTAESLAAADLLRRLA